MKQKLNDKLGFMAFIVIFILMFPFNFIVGGLVRNRRYYWYVVNEVKGKQHKQYYF
jgi:hypothetical protein